MTPYQTRFGTIDHILWEPVIQRRVLVGYRILNLRTREQIVVRTKEELAQYAADHSGGGSGTGLGDLVHRAASALGFKRCAPCAERQAALNRLYGGKRR